MIKVFTQNDLIRFLYRETSEEETKEINKALLCDSELQALYLELQSLSQHMDDSQLEPSAAAVLNIMSHARSVQEKHQ